MNAKSEPIAGIASETAGFDFEALFREQYRGIARVIARIVRDPARAEELAVEAFWKLWRTPKAQGPNARGWLYRTATRMGLDELRKQSRREKYERLFGFLRSSPTPEQMHFQGEEQRRVRSVLGAMKASQAQLLILRSDGLDYQEIAQALGLNPASIGTLLARAQQAFRKEYVKRYGKH